MNDDDFKKLLRYRIAREKWKKGGKISLVVKAATSSYIILKRTKTHTKTSSRRSYWLITRRPFFWWMKEKFKKSKSFEKHMMIKE